MKNIFDDLLTSWAKTIDEVGLLAEYQKDVAVIKYAHEDCFNIENYTPEHFPPGNEMLDEIPGEVILSYVEYGLAANGLPCYCRQLNEEGLVTFAGFYRYTPEVVEFVQYNLSNCVPSIFQRMEFTEGRKLAFLHAVANGGGVSFSGLTREGAIALAKEEEYSILLRVQHYEYEGDRIVRDVSNFRAPGAGEYEIKGYYSYDSAGILVEIKDVFSDGLERLRYSFWDDTEGLQSLATRLAAEMSEAIVNALSEGQIETPVAILQLSYHYADYYLPILNPLSVRKKEDAITGRKRNGTVWETLFLNDNWLFQTELKGIEKTFTQFMNQVEGQEGHQVAREMLQKTSALLTVSRLHGRIPVDPEFFAYSIDQSVEGHDAEDFKVILLNCGMPEQQYKKWRELGWMRE